MSEKGSAVDDDLDDLEPPVMAVIDTFDTEAEALEAARRLVEKGVGAAVVAVTQADLDAEREAEEVYDPDADADEEDGDTAAVVEAPIDNTIVHYKVEVLEFDLLRGRRALGMAEDDPTVALADDEEPMKLEKGPTPWKLLVLIWVAAMIIIPGAAFYITYLLGTR